jgi:hypothetical protein
MGRGFHASSFAAARSAKSWQRRPAPTHPDVQPMLTMPEEYQRWWLSADWSEQLEVAEDFNKSVGIEEEDKDQVIARLKNEYPNLSDREFSKAIEFGQFCIEADSTNGGFICHSDAGWYDLELSKTDRQQGLTEIKGVEDLIERLEGLGRTLKWENAMQAGPAASL